MPEFDFQKFSKDEKGKLAMRGTGKSFVTGAISYYRERLRNHDLDLKDFMWFCDYDWDKFDEMFELISKDD